MLMMPHESLIVNQHAHNRNLQMKELKGIKPWLFVYSVEKIQ